MLRVLAVLGVTAAALLAASPASASHHVLGPRTIGSACVGQPCELSGPGAVAVNEAAGVLYVVDKGHDRVERFDAATGAFLGSFDGGATFEKEPGVTEPTTEAGHGPIGFPEEVESGVFENPVAIAVDNSCSLHQPPLTELTSPTCAEFDPSYGDVYVADKRESSGGEPPTVHAVVDKFGPSGEYVGQIARNENGDSFASSGFRHTVGVAVDPAGNVWVEALNFGSEPATWGASRYGNSAGNPYLRFIVTNVPESSEAATGLAVDPTDDLYVHNTKFSNGGGSVVSKFSQTGELLAEKFGPEPFTDVAVEETTSDVYIDNGARWTHLSGSGTQLESLAVPGGHGTGIAVDAAPVRGSTVYVADSSTGLVYEFPVEPPGPPTIEATTVSAVTSTSARLEGEVNPRSVGGEPSTTWQFEYGPCIGGVLTCASSPFTTVVPVPAGQIPPSFEVSTVAEEIGGLLPETTYHFRLGAVNAKSPEPTPGHPEPTLGEERVLTTQQALAGGGLPDHRGYELVSPPEKQGSLLLPISTGLIQASASGDAITYLANGPTEPGVEGFTQTVQILSRRAGTSTSPWLSQDIATPHSGTAGVTPTQGRGEYRLFSSDLSSALVQPSAPFTSLSPQATEGTPYLRTNFPSGNPSDPCAGSCYQPLVTQANVGPGVRYGECGEVCGPIILGASEDAEHVVLSSRVGLTTTPGDVGGLYEWSPGGLQLISIQTPAEGGGPMPVVFPGTTSPVLGSKSFGPGSVRRDAISADGSRVVFSTEGTTFPVASHLYLRDTAADGGSGETLQLDLPQAGASGLGSTEPIFQTASADGSRILFTDTQQLLPGASESGADLYECEVEDGSGGLGCDLRDLTANAGGEPAGVIGLLPGAGEAASSPYFVANGVLSEGARPGECRGSGLAYQEFESQPAGATCNLYVRRGGVTRLVAILSGADFNDWARLAGTGMGGLTSRVSPNGRYLAFMSQRSLTGYDNRDAVSGKPDQEVYLYDADGNGGQGKLVCASCNPSGARPHGVEYAQIEAFGNRAGLAGGTSRDPRSWIAANVPGWTAINQNGVALYQSRYLSDQGRLFFNSADALVPGDSDGTEDVYEYEPPASASEPPPDDTCTTSSPTYSQTSGGCVDLISSGTSHEESAFMDASESGDDVFFLTSSQLSRRDTDTALDLYDARVGGGEEETAKPVECTGDACQQPAVPPNDATPGSLTFQGPENVKECPKGKVLKQGKCVAKKQQKAKHKKKHGKKKGGKKKNHGKKQKGTKQGGGR